MTFQSPAWYKPRLVGQADGNNPALSLYIFYSKVKFGQICLLCLYQTNSQVSVTRPLVLLVFPCYVLCRLFSLQFGLLFLKGQIYFYEIAESL